jgi:hypothetical protein
MRVCRAKRRKKIWRFPVAVGAAEAREVGHFGHSIENGAASTQERKVKARSRLHPFRNQIQPRTSRALISDLPCCLVANEQHGAKIARDPNPKGKCGAGVRPKHASNSIQSGARNERKHRGCERFRLD